MPQNHIGRAVAALASLALCAAATLPAAAKDAPAVLQKPLATTRLPLPHDPDNPQGKALLTCFYFPGLMVKQVDLGEVGAEQVSFVAVPPGGAKVPCRRENAAGEMVINPADWAGYFKGVKGGYVFLDAADGWNGGLGFAIFSAADGRKLFDDTTTTLRVIEPTATGLHLRYRRVYAAPCSLFADAAGCWQTILQETGMQEAGIAAPAPPDCRESYRREQQRVPKFAEETAHDPTVIYYEVDLLLASDARKMTPLPGKITCKPAD
jgi:hypothetical protein